MRFATVALLAIASAVDLDLLQQQQSKTLVTLADGPTNGEMAADEKDTLIQVLCPGPIVTSYSLSQGKSSTCNAGVKSATLVQENVTAGEEVIA